MWEIPLATLNGLTKKVIGYKVPYDIKKWNWKKDDIAILTGTNYYVKSSSAQLPREVVETWEPVYEEKKELLIGGHPIMYTGDGYISVDGIAYHKEALEDLARLMSQGQVKSLNVGCSGQYKVDANMIDDILNELKNIK